LRLLAHPGGPAPDRGGGRDCAVAVGPEGGFTDAEVEAARAAGWRPVGLGPRILRVETAALVLAALAACRS
jgi:16S rRNA (uracil1498-N3)-methyltransferase